MPSLHIDLETRSAVDLRKTGVYVYAESPTTDIWCAAYAVDDGPVELWFPGQPCPVAIQNAAIRGWVINAWNANFERTLWRYILVPRYGWPEIPLEQFRCTMVSSLALAFPGKLEDAAPALGLDVRKDQEGHALMLRMARPRRTEDDGTLIWWTELEKLQRLAAYCRTDVEVERQAHKRLPPLTDSEQQLYFLDQRINDRGVYVDAEFCDAAKKIALAARTQADARMAEASGGAVGTCSNVGHLAAFCRELGVEVDSLRKDKLIALLATQLPDPVRETLELRRDAAKASVKKIDSALAGRSADGRARGLFAFHHATTGRWAGRRLQPQNLLRPAKGVDVDQLTADILRGNIDQYGSPLAAIGNAIRGIVAAAPGKRFVAADLANIESRVLAWLADERWKLAVFAAYDREGGHDIYQIGYAQAFGIDPKNVDEQQRLIGKVMELSMGFGGGVGAFQNMARNFGVGITDEAADALKLAWRRANPQIVQFWRDLERSALKAVGSPGKRIECGLVTFLKAGSFLWVQLPSGRPICYPYPRVTDQEVPWLDDDGKPATRPTLTFKTAIKRQWTDEHAYGGRWAENVTQAVARDILAESLQRLEAAGYSVVLHAHDEAVAEVPEDVDSVEEFCRLMATVPTWATGCPIAASGWAGERYRKG